MIDIQKASLTELKDLIEYGINDRNLRDEIQSRAQHIRQDTYGNKVYIRGLIEISNYCKNDCKYCGIRRSNSKAQRYRLSKSEILECAKEGYDLGFRTFVMQGGEDNHFSDNLLCEIISNIKDKYPDCAVTLSLGERNTDSYKRLYDAGADRYLLRHETADKEHYSYLHPKEMSYENRMNCLKSLKDIGFQTGCGFMVGSPRQTSMSLAKDLVFIRDFNPQMVGIGPFISHGETPFNNEPNGSVDLTLFLLSIIRIMLPKVLLPATTALGSLSDDGRKKGILAGANVVMPNLSPMNVRKQYEIYKNKAYTGLEAAESIERLNQEMETIGYKIEITKGDYPKGE